MPPRHNSFVPAASAIYSVDRQLELFEAVVGPAYFLAVGLEQSRAACRAVGPRATYGILMNLFSPVLEACGDGRYGLPAKLQQLAAGERLFRPQLTAANTTHHSLKRERERA